MLSEARKIVPGATFTHGDVCALAYRDAAFDMVFAHSLNISHSLTHAVAHSLSLTHSLTHSFNTLILHSSAHSLIPLLLHSSTHSLPVNNSLTPSLTLSLQVTTVYTLRNFPDLEPGLREMYRVTAPGGTVVGRYRLTLSTSAESAWN